MAAKLFDVTCTKAAIEALAANTYYWIDRNGNFVTTGQSSMTGASVTAPPDVIQPSMYQAAKLNIAHGVLTAGVGGVLSWVSTSPDAAPTFLSGAPVVATDPNMGSGQIDTVLGTTAEHLVVDLVTPTTPRQVAGALAILWTTVPTTASPMRITISGLRDGQEHARG